MTADDSWRDRAACRGHDVELFYSVDEDDIRQALSICSGCEVRTTCYEHALANGEVFGVWGGTVETERRRTLRQQRRQSSASNAA